MSASNYPRYTPDEVKAILERALRKGTSGEEGITHNELVETARELGIEERELEAAIEQHTSQYEIESAREEWKKTRKKKFFEHFQTYVVVNAVLFLIDMTTSGGVWFYWPLFGWGIGLLFDASDAFFPKQRHIERGAARLVKQQRREQERLKREQRRHAGSTSSVVFDRKAKKLIIEKGSKRIEIG